MKNPNIRRDGETQKQFNERRRSEQSSEKLRAFNVVWPAYKGTYKKEETIIPQFEQSNKRKPKPISKFKGFRKVRKFIWEVGMSKWVNVV